MRATYKTIDGTEGVFLHPAILSQTMQHKDGFTLLGFKDWEAANDEKVSAAITNLVEFHIMSESEKVGF